MSNREKLNSFLREHKSPFAAAWRWATGHWRRWRALRNWARSHGVNKRKDAVRWEKARKDDKADIERLRKERAELHDEIAHLRKEVEKENARKGGPRPGRLANLEGRIDEKQDEVKKLAKRIDTNWAEVEKAERQIKVARELAKGWFKRRTIYRKKYRKAKKNHRQNKPQGFESWMLNGHSGNIDEDLKPIIVDLVVGRNQVIT
jgi:DNA repair exonuclease SbcCD ATPase subunit